MPAPASRALVAGGTPRSLRCRATAVDGRHPGGERVAGGGARPGRRAPAAHAEWGQRPGWRFAKRRGARAVVDCWRARRQAARASCSTSPPARTGTAIRPRAPPSRSTSSPYLSESSNCPPPHVPRPPADDRGGRHVPTPLPPGRRAAWPRSSEPLASNPSTLRTPGAVRAPAREGDARVGEWPSSGSSSHRALDVGVDEGDERVRHRPSPALRAAAGPPFAAGGSPSPAGPRSDRGWHRR